MEQDAVVGFVAVARMPADFEGLIEDGYCLAGLPVIAAGLGCSC